MAEGPNGRTEDKRQGGRRGRGFARAGGLIDAQLDSVAGRRGYAQARLQALWPEIAGPDCAAITSPVKLTLPRGPAGGMLTLAVSGAHAPQVQMLIPLLIERVNAALGPGRVGRIQLTHAGAAPGFAEPPPRFAPPPAAPPDLGPLAEPLSSIGDAGLRGALETLARNVLSRSRKP
ncbi:MAG: DUF721 domain-containing protein [Amaricoccus sp.]